MQFVNGWLWYRIKGTWFKMKMGSYSIGFSYWSPVYSVFGGEPTWLAASTVSQLGTVSSIGSRESKTIRPTNNIQKYKRIEHFFLESAWFVLVGQGFRVQTTFFPVSLYQEAGNQHTVDSRCQDNVKTCLSSLLNIGRRERPRPIKKKRKKSVNTFFWKVPDLFWWEFEQGLRVQITYFPVSLYHFKRSWQPAYIHADSGC